MKYRTGTRRTAPTLRDSILSFAPGEGIGEAIRGFVEDQGVTRSNALAHFVAQGLALPEYDPLAQPALLGDEGAPGWRGPVPSPRTRSVSFRVSPEVATALRGFVEDQGVTRSKAISHFVAQGLGIPECDPLAAETSDTQGVLIEVA